MHQRKSINERGLGPGTFGAAAQQMLGYLSKYK